MAAHCFTRRRRRYRLINDAGDLSSPGENSDHICVFLLLGEEFIKAAVEFAFELFGDAVCQRHFVISSCIYPVHK